MARLAATVLAAVVLCVSSDEAGVQCRGVGFLAGSHCVCPNSTTCTGTKCSAQRANGPVNSTPKLIATGYNPATCDDCVCVAVRTLHHPPRPPQPDASTGLDADDADDASRPFRIFVYDLPPEFNTALLADELPRGFSCRTSMYAAEVVIHELLLNSTYRTMDPEEADLFYVPLYASCYRSVLTGGRKLKPSDPRRELLPLTRLKLGSTNAALVQYLYSAMDYIRDETPFWDRYHGRDHVIPFTHDFGACFTILEESTLHPEKFQIQRLLQSAILLQFFGDLDSPCFHTWKDVVIPPLVSDPAVLAWVRGGEYVNVGAKTTGAYFRGKMEWKQNSPTPEYGRGVRKALLSASESDPFLSIHSGAIHHDKFLEEMRVAKFCVTPPGFASWSPRFVEALMSGCVPVVVADNVELPFEPAVDLNSMVIRVHEANVPELGDILKAVPREVLEAKSKAVHALRKQFVYNEPSEPGDAFNTIMRRLASKVAGRSINGNVEVRQ